VVDGSWTLMHHSPNIISNLSAASGTSPIFLFYELDAPLACVATEQYAIEFAPVGTGTHHMVGETAGSWFPDHPNATIAQFGATRDNTTNPDDPPDGVFYLDVVKSKNVPWVEVAVDMGTTNDYHDPLKIWVNPGDTFVARPPWADKIDAIPCGAGGNGAGSLVPAFFGDGGTAGKPNVATWTLGVDYDDDLDGVTLSVGVPGAPGSTRDTVFSIPDHSVTGQGGVNGASLSVFSQKYVGQGVDQFTYNEETFVFGGPQSAYGGDGAAPGGAGAGGRLLEGGQGGPGAPGGGYIIFRQTNHGDSTSGWDTAPPTAPTDVDIVNETFSSLTLLASGATDA
jgi:hypothetical protein